MTLKNTIIVLLLLSFVFACSNSKLDIDSSSVKVDIKFIDLDSTISHSKIDDIQKWNSEFKRTIPELYDYQIGYCLRIGQVSDSTFQSAILDFRRDKYMAKVENRISEKFKDKSRIKENLISAFQHLKYHFPKGKIPSEIVFMNSIFNSNCWSSDKEIGIGLERYLGKNTDVIKQLPPQTYYPWIKERMDVTYLERDALCSWILTHYVPEGQKDLAEAIIRWGKILYLTEASLPNLPKNVIMRYTQKDYDYAIKNEYNFWKYLCDEKLLFKLNETTIANMLNDAPFTSGLPDKTPDRLGQFIGWRIVQKFMEKNDVTLEQLIKTPYQNILQEYEI